MRKFAFWLSRDLILESNATLLSKVMDISWLVFYMQKVEEEKKKQPEFGERESKKFHHSDQGGGQK